MKILVTGAKGQLGNKIEQVLGKIHDLVLTDYDNMDITDIEAVRQVVSTEKPHYIIHAAAYTKVDKAEEEIELCRKINSLGTKNIATVAKEFGAHLIYISTDFVFDGLNSTKNGPRNKPYKETDIAKPISIYGLTKYEGEEFIRKICDKHYIIRVAWLFGELPKDQTGLNKGTNFVEIMLRLAKERSQEKDIEKAVLKVVDDQIGSPTYTGDLVNVLAKIISETPEYGTYHFSGTDESSWHDFAKEIFKQTGTKANLKPVSSKEYPQKAKRPSYSHLDKTKIESALKIKVRSWKKMLEEYIKGR